MDWQEVEKGGGINRTSRYNKLKKEEGPHYIVVAIGKGGASWLLPPPLTKAMGEPERVKVSGVNERFVIFQPCLNGDKSGFRVGDGGKKGGGQATMRRVSNAAFIRSLAHIRDSDVFEANINEDGWAFIDTKKPLVLEDI